MTSKSEPFPQIFAFLAYETACRSENIERLLEQQNIFIKDLSIQDLSVTKSLFLFKAPLFISNYSKTEENVNF